MVAKLGRRGNLLEKKKKTVRKTSNKVGEMEKMEVEKSIWTRTRHVPGANERKKNEGRWEPI